MTTSEPKGPGMAFRYKAFVSYAHADKSAARGIHSRLETFRTPKGLVGKAGRWGEVGERLAPVFRDRDELSTGSALGEELQRALSGSEFLLVLCSPAAANSRWVNEEIRFFRKARGDEFILAAIVDGEPSAPVGPGLDGCFPPALVEPPEGSDAPREPIASDFRDDGDGRRLAFLKLAAGMLGVGLDDLVRRDAQRRQRRMAQVAAGSFAGMVLTAGLALYADTQRRAANEQRTIAEQERDTVSAALDYLVSIFEIANPATENPKTITALTILERGKDKIETELAGKPQVQAKLMGAMGDVYANLGQFDAAEALLAEALSLPVSVGDDRIRTELALAEVYYRKGEFDRTIAAADALEAAIGENEALLDDPPAMKAKVEELRAVAAYGSAQHEQAVDHYENAKTWFASSAEDHDEEIARINIAQGMISSFLGEHAEAIALLEAAHAYFINRYGENHLMTGVALNNLAFAEFEAGETARAAEVLPRALSIFENVLEPTHPNLAYSWLLYGRILNKLERFDESERAMKKSIEILAAAHGPDHPDIGTIYMRMSQHRADRGDAKGAIEAIGDAELIYRKNYQADDANIGDMLVYKALALGAAGDLEQARTNCAEGLAILDASGAGNLAWVEDNRAICRKFGVFGD